MSYYYLAFLLVLNRITVYTKQCCYLAVCYEHLSGRWTLEYFQYYYCRFYS
jgi:hypothetical protein